MGFRAVSFLVLTVIQFTCVCGKLKELGDGKSADQEPVQNPPPPSGHCQYFWFGGNSGLHHYICCNNLNEKDQSEMDACDKRTYQTISIGDYCQSGGLDHGNGTSRYSPFKCGGCKGQNEARQACLEKWKDKKLIFGISEYLAPGFCWISTQCMRDYCRDKYGWSKEDENDVMSNFQFDIFG